MSVSFVDRARLQALLLSGEKVAAVAAALGCSEGTVSNICRDIGLGHIWATAEERRQIADLLAGRALVVPVAATPAAIRLAQRLDQALAEYRSGSVSAS